jgi:hypothetical protein
VTRAADAGEISAAYTGDLRVPPVVTSYTPAGPLTEDVSDLVEVEP